MTQSAEHIIQRRVVDITVGEQSLADAVLDHIGEEWATAFDSADDQLFGDICPARETIVIDRLEISLGALAPDCQPEDLLFEYKRALEESVQAELSEANISAVTPAPADLPKGKTLAALIFLETGQLPWWWKMPHQPDEPSTPPETSDILSKAFMAFCEEQPSAANEWLQSMPAPVVVKARCIMQFGEAAVQALLVAVNVASKGPLASPGEKVREQGVLHAAGLRAGGDNPEEGLNSLASDAWTGDASAIDASASDVATSDVATSDVATSDVAANAESTPGQKSEAEHRTDTLGAEHKVAKEHAETEAEKSGFDKVDIVEYRAEEPQSDIFARENDEAGLKSSTAGEDAAAGATTNVELPISQDGGVRLNTIVTSSAGEVVVQDGNNAAGEQIPDRRYEDKPLLDTVDELPENLPENLPEKRSGKAQSETGANHTKITTETPPQSLFDPTTVKPDVSPQPIERKNQKEKNSQLEKLQATRERSSEKVAEIAIENAGLVLVAPFLPTLFDKTDYLTEGDWKDPEMKVRAMHLLEYVATGEADPPEYLLTLNKLMCGADMQKPVPRSLVLTAKEKSEADNMLVAVISHWAVLGSTSISGLRTSFLTRRGLLSEDEDHWLLRVEKRPFDMLLDSIPWGYGRVMLSWMPKTLEVEW